MEHNTPEMYGLSAKEAEKSLMDFALKLRNIEEKYAISFIIPKLSFYQRLAHFFKNLL